jgi:hypothetical protein
MAVTAVMEAPMQYTMLNTTIVKYFPQKLQSASNNQQPSENLSLSLSFILSKALPIGKKATKYGAQVRKEHKRVDQRC